MKTTMEIIKDEIRKRIASQGLSFAIFYIDYLTLNGKLSRVQHQTLSDWALSIKNRKFELVRTLGTVKVYKCFKCLHEFAVPIYKEEVRCLYCGNY